MLDKELAALWDEALQDDDFRFELKAQDIAVKLASAVAAQGLTQKALADRLGWKTSRVSKVLHGATNLTLKTMFQICEALGIDFDVHFGGEHHLNKQFEVIKMQEQKLTAMLHRAEKLNRASWRNAGKSVQKETIFRTRYESQQLDQAV
ncbi:MAG: helix-turn-helix domain-containing protein [Gammaproteobacteria bacterium]|nr:helix-turn-helix domain-containing protein [Gammaproteobacteria bacterium]